MDGSGYFSRLSQCVGKEAFSTPQLAKKVQRRRATRADGGWRRKQHVYHCKHCGHFHIGTPAKSRQNTTSGRWRYQPSQHEEDSMG